MGNNFCHSFWIHVILEDHIHMSWASVYNMYYRSSITFLRMLCNPVIFPEVCCLRDWVFLYETMMGSNLKFTLKWIPNVITLNVPVVYFETTNAGNIWYETQKVFVCFKRKKKKKQLKGMAFRSGNPWVKFFFCGLNYMFIPWLLLIY